MLVDRAVPDDPRDAPARLQVRALLEAVPSERRAPMSALEIAESVASELGALEVVVRHNDPALDEAALEAAIETLDLRNWGDPDDDLLDRAFFLFLHEVCLDRKIYAEIGGEGRKIEILRACNGPHIVLTRDTTDGSSILIEAHDGTDYAAIRVYEAALASLLDDYALGIPA